MQFDATLFEVFDSSEAIALLQVYKGLQAGQTKVVPGKHHQLALAEPSLVGEIPEQTVVCTRVDEFLDDLRFV